MGSGDEGKRSRKELGIGIKEYLNIEIINNLLILNKISSFYDFLFVFLKEIYNFAS
jgi:hypothetical protein